jgi:hypothetical protein
MYCGGIMCQNQWHEVVTLLEFQSSQWFLHPGIYNHGFSCKRLILICMAYVLLLLMQLGVDTVPVLIGPVSYLLRSKPAKGVEKSFPLLSLLSSILPVYK